MKLTIKDPEALRLAQAIAGETGESIAEVVAEALRDRHARLVHSKSKASLAELNAIARRAAASVKGPYAEHGDYLYGGDGLPKLS